MSDIDTALSAVCNPLDGRAFCHEPWTCVVAGQTYRVATDGRVLLAVEVADGEETFPGTLKATVEQLLTAERDRPDLPEQPVGRGEFIAWAGSVKKKGCEACKGEGYRETCEACGSEGCDECECTACGGTGRIPHEACPVAVRDDPPYFDATLFGGIVDLLPGDTLILSNIHDYDTLRVHGDGWQLYVMRLALRTDDRPTRVLFEEAA